MTGFAEGFEACRNTILERYRVPVSLGFTINNDPGVFDGMTICINVCLPIETKLFVLAHLFGHTVQWNISESLRILGLDTAPGKKEEQLGPIFLYEQEASRYGLQLMHEAGIKDRDQWLSDWFVADWKFLKHYFLTGEFLESAKLLEPGIGDPLVPLAIPRFIPQPWPSRSAF